MEGGEEGKNLLELNLCACGYIYYTIVTVGFYDENIKIGRQNMINGPEVILRWSNRTYNTILYIIKYYTCVSARFFFSICCCCFFFFWRGDADKWIWYARGVANVIMFVANIPDVIGTTMGRCIDLT